MKLFSSNTSTLPIRSIHSIAHIDEYTAWADIDQAVMVDYYNKAWLGLADEALYQHQPTLVYKLARFLFEITFNDHLESSQFCPPVNPLRYQVLKLILHYFPANKAALFLPGLFPFFKEESHELVYAAKRELPNPINPLNIAITLTEPRLVQKMIDLQANINEISNQGLTVLHQVAIQHNQESVDILQLLLSQPNLDILNKQTPQGLTAFDLMILTYAVDKVELLLKHSKFELFSSRIDELTRLYRLPSLAHYSTIRELSNQLGLCPALTTAQLKERFSAIYLMLNSYHRPI